MLGTDIAQQCAMRLLSTAVLAALLTACGSGDERTAEADTAAATAATTGDSAGAMAGMQHDSGTVGADATAPSRPAPRDSNQSFLRMMSDHHEGLVAMVNLARPQLASTVAKEDAEKLAAKQKEEQARMQDMLRQRYSERHTSVVTPSNQAMTDSLRATAGPELEAMFYQQVINHHREGIAMTDTYLPTLTGEVKRMAERMKGEHQREIRDFERKAAKAAHG